MNSIGAVGLAVALICESLVVVVLLKQNRKLRNKITELQSMVHSASRA